MHVEIGWHVALDLSQKRAHIDPAVSAHAFADHRSGLYIRFGAGRGDECGMLIAVLASIAPAPTAAETVSSSDCVNISVNTKRVSQLGAAISICTRVLGGNDLSPKTRTELLVRRGVAYRNVGDLNKSLADLGAAQDLSPGDPLVSRMLAWT